MLVFKEIVNTVFVERNGDNICYLSEHAEEYVLYNQVDDLLLFDADELRQIAAKLDELNAKGGG